MPLRYRSISSFACLLVLFVIAASPAWALDCTPISTLPLDGTSVSDLIGANAVPGEPACGTDYTGQDFHVYDFTLTEPSLVVLFLATGGQPFGQPAPEAELFVLNSCDPNACVATFANETGATSDPICMPAGTYYLVVASPDAGNNQSYGTGVEVVDVCTPVGVEDSSWGSVKTRF